MRIVIVAPPWVAVPPPAYGGTETVLDTLARGLQAAGEDVLLFSTGDSTCPVPRAFVLEQAAGVGVAGVPTELRHVIHAYRAALDADIVHDHTLVGPVYAERFGGLPVVTTNHGPFQSELGDYYRAIANQVPIIAISHHQASTAVETPIAAVIHHGVDPSRFFVGAGGGGYAAFLGRMCGEKGVPAAIRVARLAGVPLRIAAKMSEPAEQAYFDSQVRPLLGGDIEYLGELNATDKAELLGDAFCLLNPIAWPEPFGMVMVEALACGTPVIATAMGAAPEIVEDGVTGFIRVGETALAAAVLAAPGLDRGLCRSAVCGKFSAQRMVDEHLALYRSVLDRSALDRSVLDRSVLDRSVLDRSVYGASGPVAA